MIVHRLSVRDLKGKMDQGQPLLILDVREGFCDSDRMIPGAIHVDARDLNPDLFNLGHDVLVVVYGNKSQDQAALKVAEALQNAGFCAEALQGGWDAWLDTGFPTAPRQEVGIPKHAHEEREIEHAAQQPEQAARQPEGQVKQVRERAQEAAEEATSTAGDLVVRALILVRRLIRI